MDIIYRLRIIFWILVLIIWGIYLYQYLTEDLEREKGRKIFLNQIKRETTVYEKNLSPPSGIVNITPTTPEDQPKYNNQPPQIQDTRIMVAKVNENLDISLPQDHINKIIKSEEQISKPSEKKTKIEIPKDFDFLETNHFYLYVENGIDLKEIEKEIEYLHGEMMIDLIAFSPWTRDEKTHIYITKTPMKYQQISGRPSWSGGAANLKERKIYLFQSHEWKSILAHELTHIYFDSFFGGYDKSPLWLSEGMAVYIQVQRGGNYPLWLKENIKKLANGNYYKFTDIVEIKSLDDINEGNVKLWYAQCYSMIVLLLKIQQKDEFFQFCKLLKNGNSVSKSLYLAYGKPYTTLTALESVWKFEIKKML